MKTILYILPPTGWGGSPINLIENIKGLDKNKFKPIVLLLKKTVVADKLKELDIPFIIADSVFYNKYYKYFIHTEASYMKWWQMPKIFKLIVIWLLSRFYFSKKVLNDIDLEFDIVQINSSVLSDWISPSRKYGKVICHIQEPIKKNRYDMLYYFLRQRVKKADHIVAISNDNAKRINLPEQTTVIYNHAKLPNTKPKLVSYSSKKFLYLGGSAKIKGFETLVDALNYLDDDIIIYVAGRILNPYEIGNPMICIVKRIFGYHKTLYNNIEIIKKHPRVKVLGLLIDVNPLICETCCSISPFTVPHFSRPIIEAYLHSKPVIASDISGMNEIVTHNKNGILFPLKNGKELAKAINYIAQNPDYARKMGEAGYKDAVLKFSPKNIEQFELLYKSM